MNILSADRTRVKHPCHAVVYLFPALSQSEQAKLADSIKRHGCQTPITLWRSPAGERLIIDGRHRAEICAEQGIEVPLRYFNGTEEEAIRLAWSLNDARRHLTPQERANAGEKLKLLIAERAPAGARHGKASVEAAKVTGASTRQVERMTTIRTHGEPELQKAAEQGVTSLTDAEAIAKKPAEVQREAVAWVQTGKAKTLVQAAKKIISRNGKPSAETVEDTIARVNSQIESFCRQLTAFVNENLPDDPWLDDGNVREGARQKFKDGCDMLRAMKCSAACPQCKGAKTVNGKSCRPCLGTGRVPKQKHDQMV